MEWRVLEEYSRLSLHFTHSIQESAEKRANTVACWEITFVTITIAQSPTVDVIDIFVTNRRKSLAQIFQVLISPGELKIIKGIFRQLRDFLAVTFFSFCPFCPSFAGKTYILFFYHIWSSTKTNTA